MSHRLDSTVPTHYNARLFSVFSQNAQVAQLVEHATENRSVGGSIPPLGTININDLARVTKKSLTLFEIEFDTFVQGLVFLLSIFDL